MMITCGKCGHSADVTFAIDLMPSMKFRIDGDAPMKCANGAAQGENWNCRDFDAAIAEAERKAKAEAA